MQARRRRPGAAVRASVRASQRPCVSLHSPQPSLSLSSGFAVYVRATLQTAARFIHLLRILAPRLLHPRPSSLSEAGGRSDGRPAAARNPAPRRPARTGAVRAPGTRNRRNGNIERIAPPIVRIVFDPRSKGVECAATRRGVAALFGGLHGRPAVDGVACRRSWTVRILPFAWWRCFRLVGGLYSLRVIRCRY